MAARDLQGALTPGVLNGTIAPGTLNGAADATLPGPAQREGRAGTPVGVYTALSNMGFPADEVAVGAYRWLTMKRRVEVTRLQVRPACRPSPSLPVRSRCIRARRLLRMRAGRGWRRL